MKLADACPTIIMLLSFAAAMGYFFDGDWRRSIYWGAAALIAAVLTY